MNKAKKKRKQKEKDLQGYIDQITNDNKPILTYGDIDDKFKSGAFNKIFRNLIPKYLRRLLAVLIIGLILYGLVSGLIGPMKDVLFN